MPPLPKGAAGCVVLTTLLSIVTPPLCALVLTALM